jgi:hypothetical protein
MLTSCLDQSTRICPARERRRRQSDFIPTSGALFLSGGEIKKGHATCSANRTDATVEGCKAERFEARRRASRIEMADAKRSPAQPASRACSRKDPTWRGPGDPAPRGSTATPPGSHPAFQGEGGIFVTSAERGARGEHAPSEGSAASVRRLGMVATCET